MTKSHPYHLVNQRPWPFFAALGSFFTTFGLAGWFNFYPTNLHLVGILIIAISSFQWWRDISREGTYQGLHTLEVVKGLQYGIILFITSEVLFFFSFFWAYFHRRLSPVIELGGLWPPNGLQPFNPYFVPFLNTLVLLCSGITVTWAHHALLEGGHKDLLFGLICTVALGVYFTALQAYEYVEASFTIADSTFGRVFFVATGFHGLHVIVGTTFLLSCLARSWIGHFSPKHHFGFEAAAWYWHFVDVVWLFLFVFIYWWGGI